jgi:signal transduction histidine kinase
VENNLLRIGQEALTNAVRHGKAQHVHVHLHYGKQAFALRVSDDGCGFDAHVRADPERFGLVGMRERAQEIGARLEVNSAVGRGTLVQVTVPLQPIWLRPAG